MPQSFAKNSWKSNPRLKPFELQPKSISAGAKLKNLHLFEDAQVETDEIMKTKIRRRASFDWEIKETKEEADDLKFMTENLLKISGECIKIVTDDRPKPTIIFLRPESNVYETATFSHSNQNSKRKSVNSLYAESIPDDVYSKETKRRIQSLMVAPTSIKTDGDIFFSKPLSTKCVLSRRSSANTKAETSILKDFNPTKFNPRKVKSAKPSEARWKKLYENSSPSDVTIDRRRGLYRPFTAGCYGKVAEKQARTKSQLSIVLHNRFPSETYFNKRESLLNENSRNSENIQRKVKYFCEDIEKFKKQCFIDCESYVGTNEEVLYDNKLEKLLKRLQVF